jgi:hypothetical protein
MEQAVRGTTNAFIYVFKHTDLPNRKHNLNYKDHPINVAYRTNCCLFSVVGGQPRRNMDFVPVVEA